jgi:hypothetical protein
MKMDSGNQISGTRILRAIEGEGETQKHEDFLVFIHITRPWPRIMTLINQVTAAFLKFSEVLEPMCGDNDVLVSHDSVVHAPSPL